MDIEYTYGWTRDETDDHEVDILAEVYEGIFQLIREGLVEAIPDTDPQLYRLIDRAD